MKMLLMNPPHPSIGSRILREHQPALGLLALGGPLIDAGHFDLVNKSQPASPKVEQSLSV